MIGAALSPAEIAQLKHWVEPEVIDAWRRQAWSLLGDTRATESQRALARRVLKVHGLVGGPEVVK